jgi:hypothetical protein
MNTFNDFWAIYNSEDSYLPLYLPLVIWVSSYLYCKATGKAFHRWYALHNFHNFGVILLGQISIHCNDDDVFKERIATLWSTSYFLVDVVDCGLRLDATYLFHAVCCLVLCLGNYYTPLCQVLRMTSKAALMELSNPLMHLARRTRKAWHFALFAAMFTLCRVLWLPFIMKQLLGHGMLATDPLFVILVAFYGLNLFWYSKILRILVTGGKEDANKPRQKEE